jgi:hypothetical protein
MLVSWRRFVPTLHQSPILAARLIGSLKATMLTATAPPPDEETSRFLQALLDHADAPRPAQSTHALLLQ